MTDVHADRNAVAALAGLTAGASANASFTAPAELASGQYSLGAAAATDAAGATTVVVTGSGAPKLLERPPGAAWPAPIRLPGDPRGVKGPVVATAGQGALGIAWRVDTPRKYGGIQAEIRDPGGALSTPIVIAGGEAGGVRHPALAVDPAGDALLAYNTDTRKSHLSMRGAIAPVQVVASTQAFIAELVLAADETGRTTAAWTDHDFGSPRRARPRDHLDRRRDRRPRARVRQAARRGQERRARSAIALDRGDQRPRRAGLGRRARPPPRRRPGRGGAGHRPRPAADHRLDDLHGRLLHPRPAHADHPEPQRCRDRSGNDPDGVVAEPDHQAPRRGRRTLAVFG